MEEQSEALVTIVTTSTFPDFGSKNGKRACTVPELIVGLNGSHLVLGLYNIFPELTAEFSYRRADHQLDDVKVKIFPDSSRKRKYGPASNPAISSATPMRRRERSLYSLGIGAQPSLGNPGYATRTTRRSSGKSVAGRDSSTSDEGDEQEADEMEEEGEEQTEEDGSREMHSESGYMEAASPSAGGTTRGQEYEYENEYSSEEDLLPPRPWRDKEEPRRAPIKDATPMADGANADSGLYLARRSVITSNGFSQTRSGLATDGMNPAEDSNPNEGSQEAADSFLATLAEVAGADSSEATRARKRHLAEQLHLNSQGQPAALPEVSGARDANNDARSMETRLSQGTSQAQDGTIRHHSPPRARRSSPQVQKNPSLKLFMNGGAERLAALKHPTPNPPAANGSHLASTSFSPSTCGIWFALQAARNQLRPCTLSLFCSFRARLLCTYCQT